MWGKLLTDTYNRVRTKADEVRQQVSSTVQAQQATITKARDAILALGGSSHGRVEGRAHAIAQAAAAGLSAEELMAQLQKEASGVRTLDEIHELLLLWRMLTLQSALHSAPRFASAEFVENPHPAQVSADASRDGGVQGSGEGDLLSSPLSPALASDLNEAPGEAGDAQLRRERGNGALPPLATTPPASAVAVPPPAAPSFAQELAEEERRGEKAIYGDGFSFKEELLEARREAHRRYEKRQMETAAPPAQVLTPSLAGDLRSPTVPSVSADADPLSSASPASGKGGASQEAFAEAAATVEPEDKTLSAEPVSLPTPALDAVLSVMSLCLAGAQERHLELLHALFTAAGAAAAASSASARGRRGGGPQTAERDGENSKEREARKREDAEKTAEGERDTETGKAGRLGTRRSAASPAEGLEVLEAILQLLSTWKRNWVLERKEDARRRLEAEARHLAAKIEDCDFCQDAEDEDPLVAHNIRLLANAQLLDLQQRIICVKQQLLLEQAEDARRKIAGLASLKAEREALARTFEGAEEAVEQQKKEVQVRMTEASEVLVKEAAGLDERRTALSEKLEKLKQEREELEQRLDTCLQKIASVESEQLELQGEEEGLHLELLHVQKQYKEQIHLHQQRGLQQSQLRVALDTLGRTSASLVELFEFDAAKKKETTVHDVDNLKGALKTQVCRHLAFEKTRLQQQVQFLLQCTQVLDALQAEGEKRMAESLPLPRPDEPEKRKETSEERRPSDEKFEYVAALSAEEQALLFGARKRFLRGCRQLDHFFAETEQFVSLHREVLVRAIRQQQQSIRHRQEGEEASSDSSEETRQAEDRGDAKSGEVDPMKDLAALYIQTKKQLVPYLSKLSATSASPRDRRAGPRGASASHPPSSSLPPPASSAPVPSPPSQSSAQSLSQSSAQPLSQSSEQSLSQSSEQSLSHSSEQSLAQSSSQSLSQSSEQSLSQSSSQSPSQASSQSSSQAASESALVASSLAPLSGVPGAETRLGAASAANQTAGQTAAEFPFEATPPPGRAPPKAVDGAPSEGARQRQDEQGLGTPSLQVFDLETPPRSPSANPERENGEKTWDGDEIDFLDTDKVDNWLME
ncbi:conserved hypothetical protein [Neospora caninum Liverpool]|uniref:Uncharacterized protein n=1 Tax=Neospora caninum (strain Liverpool) TaxID=572307 RepID=F0VM63_NEOCL|nr:conserved hypothetical protein [Neospora caninum Liverpool]CBZ54341.1 conserved hypothetical protein [Neospora caninum Liverpool]CEL69046.1 TPA: hypothetical protein BN1204_047720 [Neospora caninum Liverpool]|eukprot:XP_003884372.1 conserved hypothetical protein [Neospora caninum Liverpool]